MQKGQERPEVQERQFGAGGGRRGRRRQKEVGGVEGQDGTGGAYIPGHPKGGKGFSDLKTGGDKGQKPQAPCFTYQRGEGDVASPLFCILFKL